MNRTGEFGDRVGPEPRAWSWRGAADGGVSKPSPDAFLTSTPTGGRCPH